MEQGFEVLVVTDAVAAAQLPGLDGYASAMTNVRMIANSVKTTDETLKQIKEELQPGDEKRIMTGDKSAT